MDAFFVTLSGRALLRVSGPDARDFLQNLITNDMTLLETQDSLYACLLTAQGKFAWDFIISRDGDGYVLDCEGGERAQALLQKLSMYKLRAEVELVMENDTDIYSILSSCGLTAGSKDTTRQDPAIKSQGDRWVSDPRHPEMGYRSFAKPSLPERSFEEWDRRRISLTIPDGRRDMIEGKTTMDEANMEALNGVSFEKGCYVGQELTARVKYRGLGKKHLQTVDVNNLPEKSELRSSCGDIGIALVRV